MGREQAAGKYGEGKQNDAVGMGMPESQTRSAAGDTEGLSDKKTNERRPSPDTDSGAAQVKGDESARPRTGNAGLAIDDEKKERRPLPDSQPGAIQVAGNEGARSTTGNAGKVIDGKTASKMPLSVSQPGAVRVEGNENESAASQKSNANGLRQAPAYHDFDQKEISAAPNGGNLRYADPYHGAGVSSVSERDAKQKIYEAEKGSAVPRASAPSDLPGDGKPSAVDSKEEDKDPSSTSGKADRTGARGTLTEVDRSSKSKRDRHSRLTKDRRNTVRSHDIVEDENFVKNGNNRTEIIRGTRNSDIVTAEECMLESDNEDDAEEGDMFHPGARRITGIDASLDEEEDAFVENAPEPQEAAQGQTEEGYIPKAIAIEEDEDSKDGEVDPETAEGVFHAVEVDDVEVQKSVKGFLLRHTRLVVLSAVILVIAVILSIIFGLRAGDEIGEGVTPTKQVYLNGTDRFQGGADLLLERSVSVREMLLSPSKSTPQYLALQWLANEDEAQLDFDEEEESEFIVQRYVLAVLHFATGGESWMKSLNFTTSSSECGWYLERSGSRLGVSNCDVDGFVTELILDDNNLTGTIPDEFGQLTMLTEVDLSFNKNLEGSIPQTLSMLQNLEIFRIREANIAGPIPDGIGAATKLKQFQADSNALTGSIPTTVGQLVQIEAWFSQFNSLSGSLPSEMGLMTSLQLLFLKDNSLNGSIPSTVAALTALRQVDVSFNQLDDGAENLCDIDSQALVKFEADCFEQIVPAIAVEIECSCCSSCCSEKFGSCIPNQ